MTDLTGVPGDEALLGLAVLRVDLVRRGWRQGPRPDPAFVAGRGALWWRCDAVPGGSWARWGGLSRGVGWWCGARGRAGGRAGGGVDRPWGHPCVMLGGSVGVQGMMLTLYCDRYLGGPPTDRCNRHGGSFNIQHKTGPVICNVYVPAYNNKLKVMIIQ